MKITLSNNLLDMMNMDMGISIPPYNLPYFQLKSGQEHYRLLTHLGYCFDDILISDVGTNRGASALALAQNRKNKIFSLDIENIKENDIGMDNVEFYFGNFQVDEIIQKKILDSSVIFLDIDHKYVHEIWLYNFLIEKNWKGTMICDDIHLDDYMKKFWNEVTLPKLDLTKYGHGSGTGCIFFGEPLNFDLR